MIIIIKEETFSGKIIKEQKVIVDKQSLSVKDIITQKVQQKISTSDIANPQPGSSIPQVADTEKETYLALDAFQKNHFFVLINNIQAESLEQIVELDETTPISFIKLTPLIGG